MEEQTRGSGRHDENQITNAPEAGGFQGSTGPACADGEGAPLSPNPMPPMERFMTVVTKWVKTPGDVAEWVAWFVKVKREPCVVTRKREGTVQHLYRVRRAGIYRRRMLSNRVSVNVHIPREETHPWEKGEWVHEVHEVQPARRES